MADVIKLDDRRPMRYTEAATCGCGNQEFMLVNDGKVICHGCKSELVRLKWSWLPEN